MRYLIGLAGMGLGISFIIHVETWLRIFGRWNWAEKFFPGGGTRAGIRLVGIGVFVLSFIYLTGTFDNFTNLIRGAVRSVGP